ncbi:MAG: ABC transporter permease, partial [Lachnospiraceae bacterium]|nr:ABC transporter permease [Lachnospiraceae bacterium]
MRGTSISKSTFREIKLSFGRFAAILAIVALGVGLFAGLKVTKQAMILTTGTYLEETRFFDYRLLSTLGFEEQDIEALRSASGVVAVEGAFSYDILYESESGRDGVIKAHSITDNINQLVAVSGRLPEASDECVVDVNLFPEESVGKKLVLSKNNTSEDTEHFAYGEYTIVGTVQSPYYIQFERGNTALGTGRIDGFVYLRPEGFAEDIYTEVYVKLSEDYPLYSQEYKDYIESTDVRMEELTVQSAMGRYDRIVAEAQGEINDAREELEEKRVEGESELSDAWAELEKAR